MTWPAREPADMLARLGRHWGWVFAYGVLTLLAGIFVLAWPGVTLLALAVLFGVQLIVSGIFRFVAAFALSYRDCAPYSCRRFLDHRQKRGPVAGLGESKEPGA